jgi:hypothetical protein
MESPLLIIRIRKKKLTQWLRLSHIGNPTGLADILEGIAKVGSAGNPINRYCNQAAPIGTNIMRAKITCI